MVVVVVVVVVVAAAVRTARSFPRVMVGRWRWRGAWGADWSRNA